MTERESLIDPMFLPLVIALIVVLTVEQAMPVAPLLYLAAFTSCLLILRERYR